MPTKHGQSRSLGNPADLRQSPDPFLDENTIQIEKLKQRVAQLENIVNEILIPLSSQPAKPKNNTPKSDNASEAELSDHDIAAQELADKNNRDAADRLQALMQDEQPRTGEEILAALNISKGLFKRARKLCDGLQSAKYEGEMVYFMKSPDL